MSEPICPNCNGTGKEDVVIIIAGKKHDKCSLCDGSGIATDDEVGEFTQYLQEE